MSDSAPQKDGKAPMHLLDGRFLESMARQLGAGAARAGRKEEGWRDLDPHKWLLQYRGAMQRHAYSTGTTDDTGESHYTAVAVNAMICAEFERRIRAAPVRTDVVVDLIAERFGISHDEAIRTSIKLAEKLVAQQLTLPTECDCDHDNSSRIIGTICHNCGGEIVSQV